MPVGVLLPSPTATCHTPIGMLGCQCGLNTFAGMLLSILAPCILGGTVYGTPQVVYRAGKYSVPGRVAFAIAAMFAVQGLPLAPKLRDSFRAKDTKPYNVR